MKSNATSDLNFQLGPSLCEGPAPSLSVRPLVLFLHVIQFGDCRDIIIVIS